MSKPFYPTVEIFECKVFAIPKHGSTEPNISIMKLGEAHVMFRGERKCIDIIEIRGYPTIHIHNADSIDLCTRLHVQLSILSRFKYEKEQIEKPDADSF